MKSHIIATFVFAACVLFGAHGHAGSSAELLQTLSAKLAEIKASSDKESVAIDSVIEVQSLVGTSRREILSALGEPDACANKADSRCNTQSVWVYSFYRLPKGWRGGGPELNLAFGKEGTIKEAKWKFSR